MEEIKVGDYVRTRYGQIILVDWLGNAIVTDKEGVTVLTVDGSITKHSPNIIDLIEVGDYINGCEVTQVTETQLIVRDENGLSMWEKKWTERIIKHIVTHEQFNSIKYVIGE